MQRENAEILLCDLERKRGRGRKKRGGRERGRKGKREVREGGREGGKKEKENKNTEENLGNMEEIVQEKNIIDQFLRIFALIRQILQNLSIN